MKYEAILFDMDGVLIDSEELMAKAGIMALHDFGIEARPEDFIPFVGRGEDLYIGGVAEKYGHEYVTAMKDSAYAHYGDYVETEAFVPKEIPDILFKLRDLGYKIAVCTSADKAKVVHNLRAIGVTEDIFTAIVTGDRIKNKKPDPEIYLTGAGLVDCAPEKCAVVEDAPSGIKAALAAGMLAIGIDTSFPAEHLMQTAHPDRMIHSLNELPGLLEKMNT